MHFRTFVLCLLGSVFCLFFSRLQLSLFSAFIVASAELDSLLLLLLLFLYPFEKMLQTEGAIRTYVPTYIRILNVQSLNAILSSHKSF